MSIAASSSPGSEYSILSCPTPAVSYGPAAITLQDAKNDIEFYKQSGTIPPTGVHYPGSLINWGKVDWRRFDPGLNQPVPQVLRNLVQGISALPGYEK